MNFIIKMFLSSLALFLITFVLGAGITKAGHSDYKVAVISVPTIVCGECVDKITDALNKVNGVKDVNVDLGKKEAVVKYDESVTNLTKLEKAISKAGYRANNRKANRNAYNELDDCCKAK